MMREDPQLQEQDDEPDERQQLGNDNNSNRRQKESLEIETGDGAGDNDNNDDDEYYDDFDDDDDDIAPLIQNSSSDPPAHDQTSPRVQNHHPGRRSPRRSKHRTVRGSYLFKQLMAAHDDDDRSCWHRARGTVAQLAAMLIFLFVASFIFAPQAPPSKENDGIDHCKAIMNMSIAELWQSVADHSNSTKASNSTTSPGMYDPDDAFCVDDQTMRKYKMRGCRCPSPIIPTPKMSKGSIEEPWVDTFERNKALVKDAVFTAARTEEQIDVVFYGDSITEHWVGTDLNRARFSNVVNDSKVFQEYFGGVDTDAPLKGIALGIGGDMCEHVLYRLQNGELPSSLYAKVFWILIGTNDLGAYACNSESIAAGTIKIVQKIQEKTRLQQNKEVSTIVLNSILPRAGGTKGHPTTNVFDSNNDFQWPTIQRINQWLQCYADSTAGVEFFNATDIFLDEDGNGRKEYFDDPVHPSAEGHKHWAEAIVKKVNEIVR